MREIKNMNNDSLEKSIINEEMQALRNKKKFKIYAICFSIFYIIIFPVLLMMVAMSFMVFGGARTSAIAGFTMIGCIYCIPSSVLVTIPLLVLRYFREKYSKPLLFCLIPIYTFICVFVVMNFLDR